MIILLDFLPHEAIPLQVLRVGKGDVVKREGLGLVAWPKGDDSKRRRQTKVIFNPLAQRGQITLSRNEPGWVDRGRRAAS